MRVFLVENSPLVRERLRAVIEKVDGVEMVGEAASVDEATRAIPVSRAEAVVLDLHLDGGSGFDVMRALQKSAPATAVYVLTSFVNDSYRRAAERLGARGFFDKTNEIPSLLAALGSRRSGVGPVPD